MSYTVEMLEEIALAAIELEGLVFVQDIAVFLPCCRATMYNFGIDKLDSVRNALTKNKCTLKQALRRKWEKSDNATLQIMLYKLIADDFEFARLAGSKNEISTTGNQPVVFEIGIIGDDRPLLHEPKDDDV